MDVQHVVGARLALGNFVLVSSLSTKGGDTEKKTQTLQRADCMLGRLSPIAPLRIMGNWAVTSLQMLRCAAALLGPSSAPCSADNPTVRQECTRHVDDTRPYCH